MLVAKRDLRVPPRTSTIGVWLLLASLTMLFASSMLAYVLIRFTGPSSPSLGTLAMPPALWLSTLLVVGGSATIHLAVRAVQRERQGALRRWLWITLGLAVAFVAVQAPALIALLGEHQAQKDLGVRLYGLVFVLVLLHAAHVAGGIVQLAIVAVQALRRRYDHEDYRPVRHAAMYWHFLDVVWLFMFATMFALG